MRKIIGAFMPSYLKTTGSGGLRRLTGGILYDFMVAEKMKERGFELNLFDLEALPRAARFLKTPSGRILWEKARRKPFHVLITDLGTSPLTLGIQRRASRRGILTVLLCHHFRGPLETPLPKRILYRFTERWIVAGAGLLVANSPHTLSVLEDMGRSREDIIVAPPGLGIRPVQAPPFRERPERVLMVANIEERKGVMDAVRAVNRPGLEGTTLTVVGGDDLEPDYAAATQNLIRELGLASRVRLAGRLTEAELLGAYRTSDAFMLLSRWEGYGMAIAEAMASGLPVISTTAGAIPHLVEHGVTGLLVEPGDWRAAGDLLERLFTDGDLRRRLAGAALERSAAFPTWDETTERIVQGVLERLPASPSRKRRVSAPVSPVSSTPP